MQYASLKNRCEKEDFPSEYILLKCEALLFHQTITFYNLFLVCTKVKTSHDGLNFNLSVVGDNSVCHDDGDKIQMIFQNSFAFTVWGWDWLGREGSHTQFPPPYAGISASWQGVYKNWPGSAASKLRGKSMKKV